MTGRPTDLIEIYALCDPLTNEIRYVGKSKNSLERFKGHLRDSRRFNTPVYVWIRELAKTERLPLLRILATTNEQHWKYVERLVIAQERSLQLLNLSAGGNAPYCSYETRVKNARANVISRTNTPLKARVYYLKRQLGMALKQGYVNKGTKQAMRYAARKRPDLFGLWANL